ncbi:MAG: rhodanese-like domain-containing protein [Bacteroidota bacterium]
MGFFDLFGDSNSTSIEEYLDRGAIVIDVRTEFEFTRGHIKDSINIPLNSLGTRFQEIVNMEKPIITCCQSGARSGSAANVLKQNGIDTINGGPWQNVANCVKEE